jgi:hypothetical protein
VFGRVEGFFVMLCIIVVGMAMKAACTNVQTYFAGHILYWSGHIGVLFVCDIMAADITSLKKPHDHLHYQRNPSYCSYIRRT